MKMAYFKLYLLWLVMFLSACRLADESRLTSHGFETGLLTFGVGYDARIKLDEFNFNGEYDSGEALMANWPLAVTKVDEKGTAIGETRIVETGVAEHPDQLPSLKLNAGYYRLDYFLPDEHLNQGKVEWVTSKPFEAEIINIFPNKNILNIKMVFCRNTGDQVAIFDYTKFCLPKHFPVDLPPAPNKAWKLLGGVLNSGYVQSNNKPYDIELNYDEPIVALAESTLSVKRWDGTAWTQVGGVISPLGWHPSLEIDASGNPVVAWADGNIYVARWDGTTWARVGGGLATAPDGESPALVLDANGNPVVAWLENQRNIYVKRWNGAAWVQLGGAITTSGYEKLSLTLDSNSNPVVAFEEIQLTAMGNDLDVKVKRWNGSAWVQIGSNVDVASPSRSSHPSLVPDGNGHFFVAWEEYTTHSQIHVKRWTGSAWVQVGSALNTQATSWARHPSLKLDGSSNPVLAFSENGTIKVKRWTGFVWSQVGQPLDVDSTLEARLSALALNQSGDPVVIWAETDEYREDGGGGTGNLYVHRWE